MATQAEIDAAAKAIRDIEAPDQPVFEFVTHAHAALEAADLVRTQARPSKQSAAERARRYRARKRDGRDAIPVASG